MTGSPLDSFVAVRNLFASVRTHSGHVQRMAGVFIRLDVVLPVRVLFLTRISASMPATVCLWNSAHQFGRFVMGR